MQPELYPGQQVLVQNFDARGKVNYLEQRFAFRHKGRVLVRRGQMIAGGLRLFGRRDEDEIITTRPDGWSRPEDWKTTGRLHPDLVALGPLVTAYRSARGGRHTYLATVGWSN